MYFSFPKRPDQPALGNTQSPIQWVSGFFAGDKAAGVWRRPLSSI